MTRRTDQEFRDELSNMFAALERQARNSLNILTEYTEELTLSKNRIIQIINKFEMNAMKEKENMNGLSHAIVNVASNIDRNKMGYKNSNIAATLPATPVSSRFDRPNPRSDSRPIYTNPNPNHRSMYMSPHQISRPSPLSPCNVNGATPNHCASNQSNGKQTLTIGSTVIEGNGAAGIIAKNGSINNVKQIGATTIKSRKQNNSVDSFSMIYANAASASPVSQANSMQSAIEIIDSGDETCDIKKEMVNRSPTYGISNGINYGNKRPHTQQNGGFSGMQQVKRPMLSKEFYAARLSEAKQFRCEVCNLVIQNKVKFEVHIRSHTGERPYKCQHCPKKFAGEANLKAHVKRVHAKVLAQKAVATTNANEIKKQNQPCNYQCYICKNTIHFGSIDKLKVHMCKHTGKKEPVTETVKEVVPEKVPEKVVETIADAVMEPAMGPTDESEQQMDLLDDNPLRCKICLLLFSECDALLKHLDTEHI